jgi:SOS-response transcriptional repressor LexA
MNNENLGNRVRKARKHAGFTQNQLAKKVKTSQGAISDIENGRNKDSSSLYDIAKTTGVSTDWLIKNQGEMLDLDKVPSIDDLRAQIKAMQGQSGDDLFDAPTDTQHAPISDNADMVPILSWVAAGSWSNVDPVMMSDAIGKAPRPAKLSKLGFALIVRGESMLPKFDPGDIIYVEPQTGFLALKNADLIIVQCNDDKEATFKQLVLGETSEDMYLRPLNPNWHEQKMVPMGECNLVGKVVGKYVEY